MKLFPSNIQKLTLGVYKKTILSGIWSWDEYLYSAKAPVDSTGAAVFEVPVSEAWKAGLEVGSYILVVKEVANNNIQLKKDYPVASPLPYPNPQAQQPAQQDSNNPPQGNPPLFRIFPTPVWAMLMAHTKPVIPKTHSKTVIGKPKEMQTDKKTDDKAHKPVIMLDPGHGDKYILKDGTRNKYLDSGTLSRDKKVAEKDITLSIAEKLQSFLQKLNYEVYLTRLGDKLDAGRRLEWRVQEALAVNADIFISIHADDAESLEARGFSVLYHYGDKKSILLAEDVFKTQTTMPLREVRDDTDRGSLYVLRRYADLGRIAILIETGFMSNAQDLKLLQEKDTDIAQQIAQGVDNFINNSK